MIHADSLMQRNINGALSYEMHYTLEAPKGPATTMITQPYFFSKSAKLDGPVSHNVIEQ